MASSGPATGAGGMEDIEMEKVGTKSKKNKKSGGGKGKGKGGGKGKKKNVTIAPSPVPVAIPKKVGKRHKAKNTKCFKHYIFTVLKQVHPDKSISTRAMQVMDSLVHDMLCKIGKESGDLARSSKTQTIKAREIQSATKLVFRGELAYYGIAAGTKAVETYVQALAAGAGAPVPSSPTTY